MIKSLFVNYGSDAATLQEISKSVSPEIMEKAIDKSKLVQKEVTYKTRSGKIKTRKQWVRAGVEQKNNSRPKKEKQESRARDFKVRGWDKKYQENRPNVPYQYISVTTGEALTTAQLDEKLFVEFSKSKYKGTFSEFRKSSQAEKFVKTNFFISDGATQTEDYYKVNGQYTPERKKLHDKIIKSIVDSANKPPKGQKPVAILMGGGSASGKGTIRKSVVIPTLDENGIKAGISDSDDIKNELPEYQHFQDQFVETAAYRVHEESSYIADRAIDALVDEGKNLLFDGTMKNMEKYTKLIDKLHKAGYEVQIVGADVPLDLAIERSDKRAEETGRKVPHGIIEGSHGGFAMTLPKLVSMADSSVLYDNSLNGEPRLVLQDGEVKNQELYDRFVEKGNAWKVTKQIRDMSKEYDVPEDTLKQYVDQGMTPDELNKFLSTMGAEGLEEI